jgi:class 3 adenylate cyclase
MRTQYFRNKESSESVGCPSWNLSVVNEVNEPSQNVIKYRVAHINIKGADLIIFPLDPSIGRMGPGEQTEVVKSLQRCAASAGLKGNVVAMWDKGAGKTGMLAEKNVLPYIQNLSLAFVQSKVNREISVKGQVVCASPISRASDSSEMAETKQRGGNLSITSDIPDCDVYIDGSFVGNIPTRIRLKEGPHLVEVRKGGYCDYRKEIQISDGSDINLRPMLESSRDFESSPTTQTTKVQAALSDQNVRGKVAEFKRKQGTGLTTLFFSDIVGSTKLKQELGDRDAVALMQKHHTMVRALLSRYPEAQEISTAGDSFFIVFDKPSDGVKFSLQVQAKMRAQVRDRVFPFPIKDRIGIHVGEVFIEDGGDSGKVKDLFGIQVDTCARVMSLGEGDQILMTRFAYDNARQVLKGQSIEGVGPLKWINHGPYMLKGVEDPLDICEVGEDGLAVLQPPVDSDKVQRYYPPGTKPAAEATPHVVVNTRSSFNPGRRFPSS